MFSFQTCFCQQKRLSILRNGYIKLRLCWIFKAMMAIIGMFFQAWEMLSSWGWFQLWFQLWSVVRKHSSKQHLCPTGFSHVFPGFFLPKSFGCFVFGWQNPQSEGLFSSNLKQPATPNPKLKAWLCYEIEDGRFMAFYGLLTQHANYPPEDCITYPTQKREVARKSSTQKCKNLTVRAKSCFIGELPHNIFEQWKKALVV